jgi:hypothetical protein
MCTCAILGQAVGAAAAVAFRHGETPRGVYRSHLKELQQTLMEDDCWLPGLKREIPALSKAAKLTAGTADAEVLRNGHDRPIGEADNGLLLAPGAYAEYTFEIAHYVSRVRLVFDSDLNRETQHEGSIYKRPMYATYYLDTQATFVPRTLVRSFNIVVVLADGTKKIIGVTDNHQRLVYVNIGMEALSVRFEPVSTWGNKGSHVFAFEVL